MRLVHSPMAATDAASIANSSNNPNKDAFAFANDDADNDNNNGNSNGNNAPLLLRCTPGDATVDYDVNVTRLYEHIGDSDWKMAIERCRQHPGEASTWVVRYRRDAAPSPGGGGGGGAAGPGGDVVAWRFLPIHSACALDPPAPFVRALLQCHPLGARTLDHQGMLPLHYACGARCSREVLYLLLMSFPEAALRADPNGMLPLHYLAQWGPGGPGAVDMVCAATGRKVGGCVDGDGNTAEMLASNAEYEGSGEVARKIRDFGLRFGGGGGDGGGGVGGLSLASSHIAIDNAMVGAPMSPMSASSYKNRVATLRNLSVQTAALTPRGNGHHHHHQNGHGGHNRHNSAPADKYSSFEDDGSEQQHYGGGNNAGDGNNGGGGGGIIATTTTTTNNSNNINNSNENSWNMTPRSGRQAMDRLGVSPNNHRGYYQHATDRGGGGGGGGGYTKNRRDPTPDPASRGRDFSSRHSPMNGNARADPPAAGGSRRSSSTPRSFGPTLVDNNDTGTYSHRNNDVAPKPATATTFTTANATITSDYGDYGSVYNPTGVNHAAFSSKGNIAPAPATATTSATASTASTGNSRTIHIPQYGSSASSHNTAMSVVGLPPKSPRFPPTTPKHGNLKDNAGDGGGGGGIGYQNQVQHREYREPGESDSDRQDRRLAELREELSSARIAGGGGGGGSGADARQPNHRPPAALVRFEEDEAREPPPRVNDLNAVGGGSVGNSSLRSGQSGSTRDGSNLNSGRVSHLTQRLTVYNGADKWPNDGDVMKKNDELHDEAGKTEQVLMEDMRMQASMEAAKTEERDAAIHAIQHEKHQREKALMEEIESLRAGKEHAEAALNLLKDNVRLYGSEDASKKEEGDQNDDDVSKLTFQNDFDHAEGVEVIVSSRVKEGISSSDTTNTNSVSSSLGSHHNDVERLMREKVEIESAIQRAMMIQSDNEVRALANAPNVSTDQSSGITEETDNKIAMLTEEILREQKKSSELELEIFSLKAGNQNSEAVYNHLQEVKCLRESFDKARVDIENYRKDAEDILERKEMEWDKERCALFEQAAVEVEKCRDDAKVVLETKEREWNDERRILIKKIEDYTIKCAMAQTEIEEYREDAKSLREGFDKAKIDIDKYRDDAERVLNTKEREWNDKQSIFEEQIKDLSDKLSLAQNDERKERALMEEDNELQWREERERLLMEIKLLKENMATGLDSNQSMTSTIKSDSYGHNVSAVGSSSSSNDNGTMVHLRMQLANAVTEAEDMRNYNAVIRKEHDKTVEALESELIEERKCRTGSLGEIVTLQYKIARLEQELEDAKEDNKERLVNLQPTPRNRSHDSHSFQSSQDSRSYHSIEEVRSLEMELYQLKETLRLRLVEAKEYRQELDAAKRMVEEKERGADMVKETLQYKISTLEKELEDAKESNKQLLVNMQPTPRNRSLDSNSSYSSSHDFRSYHSIEECRSLETEVYKLKKTLRDQEEKYLEQISDLNKKDQDKLKKTLKEKMDDADEYRRELDEKIRELRKKHEQDLTQREDALRAELRHQEENYLKQISDLKKKEQALTKQRDDLRSDPYSAGEIDKLMKQKDENNEKRIKKIISEKDEDFKLRLKKILEEKEEEFEISVAELEGGIRTLKEIIASKDEDFKITVAGFEDEIKMLNKELEVGTHKKELGECKKELDRQRRKHRSEMNQLNNTLELQKSKQERLQSHIQSLEKQISDMVNDYESKLMSAYYGNVDELR